MNVQEYINANMTDLRKISRDIAFKFFHDPDDLLQDSLERAIRFKDKYSDDTGLKGFLGWFYRLTYRYCLDCYRKNLRTPKIVDIESSWNISTSNHYRLDDRSELARTYRVIRSKFSSLDARIMYLTAQGYKNEETSQITGLHISTVKTRIHRIRKYLSGEIIV